jgi:hypothetical protein
MLAKIFSSRFGDRCVAYPDPDPALDYSIECEFENPDPYQKRLNTEDRNAPRIKTMYNA